MPRIYEDRIVTPTLLQRFELEAEAEDGDGRHYGVILRDTGRDLMVHQPPNSPSIAPEQMLWAERVLKLLNRELHHDGAWVVVFTHPKPPVLANVIEMPKHWQYGRYALIWLDLDGDPQFTMDWMEGAYSGLRSFADVVMAGIESTAHKAEGAWQTWHTAMRALIEPKEGQTFKRAQGQVAESVRARRH